MIDIKKKEDCVGCNACVQRCPKTCIFMIEDEQGFLYPKVDLNKCIDCHLCEKVCPVINQAEPIKPIRTYAAKNNNEEDKETSSSGGVFFALVEYVIKEKQGVVFGARFNDKWEVVHDYAEAIKDAEAFKGSKYVQSRIGDNFKKAEEFLKSGRTVLFSGTPCQIAALRLFLRKDYGAQLITVDIACHGVPSPLVWKDYLNSTCGNTEKISRISFRDKRNGWQNYGMSIYDLKNHEMPYSPMNQNLYMQGFLKDLYLRPSCYACPAKCGKSHADITLADFWGINKTYPQLYENEYYSLVLAHSNKGLRVLDSISIDKQEAEYLKALSVNPSLEQSARKPKERDLFWEQIQDKGISALSSIINNMKPSFHKRSYSIVCRIGRKILRVIGLKQ